MPFDRLDHRLDQRVPEVMGLKAQVEQLLMLGVVVMLLALHSWVRQMHDGGFEPVGRPRIAHLLSQRLDGELLGELIEDAILALGGWMLEGQSHAGHRIADIEESPRLPTLSINRERQPERAL